MPSVIERIDAEIEQRSLLKLDSVMEKYCLAS
jgi:hypothetical protein